MPVVLLRTQSAFRRKFTFVFRGVVLAHNVDFTIGCKCEVAACVLDSYFLSVELALTFELFGFPSNIGVTKVVVRRC